MKRPAAEKPRSVFRYQGTPSVAIYTSTTAPLAMFLRSFTTGRYVLEHNSLFTTMLSSVEAVYKRSPRLEQIVTRTLHRSTTGILSQETVANRTDDTVQQTYSKNTPTLMTHPSRVSMVTTSKNTALVSAFDLHHSIDIRYPAIELLGEHDQWKMYKPKDNESRYEPLPLIEDPRVVSNTYRDEEEDTRFVSYTKALPGHSEDFPDQPADINDDHTSHNVDALVADMHKLSTCAGSTQLRIVIYKPAVCKPEQRVRYMIIHRLSKLHCAAGSVKDIEYFYAMPLYAFKGLANTETSHEPWYRDARDLVLGMTERAVRHLRFTLQQEQETPEGFDWAEFTTGWLPQRPLSLVPLICNKITEDELKQEVIENEDATECHICKLPFDHDEAVPVKVNDGCQHIYCHSCLMTWVSGNGNTAQCPMCRDPLTSPVQYVDLTHGIDNSGHYVYDDRYNEWENFERSCADLDRTQAGFAIPNDHNAISVNAKLLGTAWHHFISEARAEQTSSTPSHHNPANYPELQIVERCLLSGLNQIDGTKIPTSTLRQMLTKDIENALFKAFVGSEATCVVRSGKIALAYEDIDRAEKIMDLKPDLWPFVERTINRVVNLVWLRHCECVEAMGLHVHGACRMYYNN